MRTNWRGSGICLEEMRKDKKKLVRIAGLCMKILIRGKCKYLEFNCINDTVPRKYQFL
jgi:hypothetical protein